MTNLSSALANLKSEWHALNDLDRGCAVLTIHQNGTSVRELAAQLSCSESLLRHLLLAIQAPAEHRLLARKGKLTTNELVRRAKAAGICRTAKHREAIEFERTQAAVEGSKVIRDWLVRENLSGPYCESMLCDAQRQLANAEQTNRFPPGAAPADMPVAEIIRSCRPPALNNDAIQLLAWFAYWLALWTYYAFTDSDVRFQALEVALEVQFKR